MAMSYSYELQTKVFDRMTELETRATSSRSTLPDFTNPVIAARPRADEVEAKQAALVQLEAAKPSVEFVQKYAEADSTKCLGDVAKVLGHKPHSFSKMLASDGVISSGTERGFLRKHHLDAGRFVVRTGVRHGFAFNQIRVNLRELSGLQAV